MLLSKNIYISFLIIKYYFIKFKIFCGKGEAYF